MERGNFSAAAGFGSFAGKQGIFATFSAFLEMCVSEITMSRLNFANVLAHFSHSGVDDMADNTCHFGINSMFALSSMGLLYMYLMRHTSKWRNAILVASILPIAFAANVVRVIVLVLVTYHFGDAAGQGFIHGFSGIALFIIALLILFALDALLGATLFRSQRESA